MSSIAAVLQPPPPPYSEFFNGGGNENYEATAMAPFQEWVSTSDETGMSNGVVITVIVFSITIIVSILLCFVIRLLSKRCVRRVEIDEESDGSGRVLSSRRRVRIQPVEEEVEKHRQSPIQTVSITVKETRPGKSELGTAGDCPICLSGFEPKDELRLLPICCHAFHAECVDLWLESSQSCPLCRSPIFVPESEIIRKVLEQHQPVPEQVTAPTRIVLNQHQPAQSPVQPVSLVRVESENKLDQLHTEIEANRSWLREYLETLSSRTASLRNSTRYFTGSSRRSDALPGDAYWDVEASRAGEEISEMFRWFSGF